MSLESSKNEFEIRLRRVVELITDNKDAYSQKLLDAVDCLNDEYHNHLISGFTDILEKGASKIYELNSEIELYKAMLGFKVCDGCEMYFNEHDNDGCTVNDETTQCGGCVNEETEQAR